ncbi:MAG: sodium-dependent transporter [Clostridium sp.]|nr:sodium-dependent transporter [Clostridium sp.]
MEKRENFGSRLGFILVAAGCAIGIGNVWKFPYICGEYGGAAFILIYLIFLVILGFPILVCEFAVGRGSRKSLVNAFETLEPKGQIWHKHKWVSLSGNYLLVMFYTMVTGWILNYSYKMLTGTFEQKDTSQVKAVFSEMLSNSGEMILWTVIGILIAVAVCSFGIKNGIEKVTKVMMILLISLMGLLVIRSLTLGGTSKGLEFYLVPNFDRILEVGIGNVLFAAMSHAFFTLSIGMGAMEIFGSYMKRDRTIAGESVTVVILDTLIALVAGLIIIPSCFAYNIEPDAGPSLLFITLPNVFNNMPLGNVWGTIFFIFMSFAALSTLIGVFENIVSMSMEAFNVGRKKSVIYNFIVVTILSMPAVLGYNVLNWINPLGGSSTIMDLEDFIVSYNVLPLGSLVCLLFCVKDNGWGFDNFLSEVNTGEGMKFPRIFKNHLKYVLPSIIIVIYLKGYYDMFKQYDIIVQVITMLIALLLLGLTFFITLKKKNKN